MQQADSEADNVSETDSGSGTDSDDATIDDLAERVIEAHHAAGGKDLGETDRVAAQARAREIINEARDRADDNGALAGLHDMRKLSLAIGMPVPRILFNAMIDAAAVSESRRRTWRRQLKFGVKETGCIQVDFQDIHTKENDIAYLVLDKCGPGHDLSAELDKLYTRIPESRQDEIRKHLSVLVYLGRAAYSQMMAEMMLLLTEIGKKIPCPADDAAGPVAFDPRMLGVDPANTTIYIPYTQEQRVGIFVRFASADHATLLR